MGNIIDLPDLKGRERVFRDRAHAGRILADLLQPHINPESIVMAIPAGGVPVGSVVAHRLKLPLDVAVVSKITFPWNTEAGYGAVAFDGTFQLNQTLIRRLDLTEEDIQKGIGETTLKVENRVTKLRGERPFPNLKDRRAILIDDGVASGFTMKVAIEALKRVGAANVAVAIPTAHAESVQGVLNTVDDVFCPNLRRGWQFAVASAYEKWTDVTDTEVIQILENSQAFKMLSSKL